MTILQTKLFNQILIDIIFSPLKPLQARILLELRKCSNLSGSIANKQKIGNKFMLKCIIKFFIN
jgi:hypothetical protein